MCGTLPSTLCHQGMTTDFCQTVNHPYYLQRELLMLHCYYCLHPTISWCRCGVWYQLCFCLTINTTSIFFSWRFLEIWTTLSSWLHLQLFSNLRMHTAPLYVSLTSDLRWSPPLTHISLPTAPRLVLRMPSSTCFSPFPHGQSWQHCKDDVLWFLLCQTCFLHCLKHAAARNMRRHLDNLLDYWRHGRQTSVWETDLRGPGVISTPFSSKEKRWDSGERQITWEFTFTTDWNGSETIRLSRGRCKAASISGEA